MGDAAQHYEQLVAHVRQLHRDGKIPVQPSRDQKIDWIYGNTKIENDAVTREMAERSVDTKTKV